MNNRHQNEPRIYNLYVRPTYAVHLPQPRLGAKTKSIRRVENEKNLRNNSTDGVLSAKAQKRLLNSVNWLIASAKRKWFFDRATNKRFFFRVNFITLTLPTLEHNISDHKFKTVLLHAFINACRYRYGLSNYVWKVEAQANGNIHAHFTTDCFIHWKDLRRTWNKILASHGLIDSYASKHKHLSESEYLHLYRKRGVDIKTLRKAYAYGVATNWEDPNTTDVKAVHKIDDIGAYMAKYMAKNEDDRRKINGRLWACSYSLSEKNALTIECTPGSEAALLSGVDFSVVQSKPIERLSAFTGRAYQIGEILFYKLGDWGKSIVGELYTAFQQHCFEIRSSSTLLVKEMIHKHGFEPPQTYNFNVPVIAVNNQLSM